MSKPIIEVNNISKLYRLGIISAATLRDSVERWWCKKIGKEELIGKIGAKHLMISPDDPQAGPEPNTMWALKDVSFTVQEGEMLGVIGSNGAGKSTLLKILSRITEPTKGTAIIRGKVGSLLEVGTGFHPELTGRENTYLNGAILGMRKSEIDRKFDEIVTFASVEKFIDTPIKHYSSGMYVRLAFAVAAHLEPEILLVDEVLAVGDAAFQNKCLGKMGEIQKQGRTIVFVSHNMTSIAQLCSKGFLFKAGRLEFNGKITDVINKYMLTISEEQGASIDFKKIKRNTGQEFASLMHLDIFNEEMKPSNVFAMGESIIARIRVRCNKKMECAEVGLKISSTMGIGVHLFTSTWEGLKEDLVEGEYVFEVKIPNISLLPGKYLVGVWISRDGDWSDDSKHDAAIIGILSRDITGNFKALNLKNTFEKYASYNSAVYAPSKWSIIERNVSNKR